MKPTLDANEFIQLMNDHGVTIDTAGTARLYMLRYFMQDMETGIIDDNPQWNTQDVLDCLNGREQ